MFFMKIEDPWAESTNTEICQETLAYDKVIQSEGNIYTNTFILCRMHSYKTFLSLQ